jgi:diguanylate cyclase (GGDEF)-like protein
MPDPLTIVYSATLVAALVFLLAFASWRNRRTYPGFGWWVASLGLFALALLLIAFRDLLAPPLLRDVIVNLVSVLCFGAIVVGAGRFFERPTWDPLLVTLAVAGVLGIVAARGLFADPRYSIAIGATCVGLIAIRAGTHFLGEVPGRLRGAARVCAAVLIGMGLARLWRAGHFLSAPPGYLPLEPDLAAVVNYSINLGFALLWSFAFIQLNSSRVEAELRSSQTELAFLANSDPLTGLANRRTLFEVGEREVQRARRFGRPLSVVVLDIDFFKSANDRYGHPAGDAVLRAVADQFRGHVRDADTIARLGGDEFAAILLETSAEAAQLAGDRLRAAIASTPVELTGALVTASLGIASLSVDDVGFAALLGRADAALYRAKGAGRNRLEVA